MRLSTIVLCSSSSTMLNYVHVTMSTSHRNTYCVYVPEAASPALTPGMFLKIPTMQVCLSEQKLFDNKQVMTCVLGSW